MNKKSTDVSLQIMTFAFLFTFVNGFNISMFQIKYGLLEEKWLNSLSFCFGLFILCNYNYYFIVSFYFNLHKTSIKNFYFSFTF